MHRLLYISTARTILSPEELRQILLVSRRNNGAAGVTGLLVVGGKRFLQALEGPEEAVRATFARIERDPRHFAIVKLADQPTDTLSFQRWSMGFEEGGSGGSSTNLTDQIANIVAPIADASLRAYFTGFARSHSS